MRQELELVSVTQSSPGKAPPPSKRRGVFLLCLAVWTVFVALALCWLLRGDTGPSIYILRGGDSAQQATFEKFRAWFKADLGVQRAYPWVLLGPYVALIAFCFLLKRARLRLKLAMNLAACAGFVAASHAISVRTSLRGATVMLIRSEGQAGAASGSRRTSVVEMKVTKAAGSAEWAGGGTSGFIRDSQEFGSPKGAQTGKTGDSREPVPLEMGKGKLGELSDIGISNLLVQMRPGMNPVMPAPGLARLGLLSMLLDLLAYCAVMGLAHSVHFYRRFREREHQALFLESNLAQARLNALRAQLQPHFLFNSLNAIAALLRRDPRLAEATLLSLSELLRLALSQSERQEVSLREEINLGGLDEACGLRSRYRFPSLVEMLAARGARESVARPLTRSSRRNNSRSVCGPQ